MDLTRLKHIVEIHRPLSIFSSLPFAIEKNGELKVRWFVYDLTQYGSMSELVVKRILTLDQTGRVDIEMTRGLTFMLNDVDADGNDYFDEDEYYKEFALAFNMRDMECMNELLTKSELPDSIKIYQSVATYVEPVLCA